jgi:hypothetical protein
MLFQNPSAINISSVVRNEYDRIASGRLYSMHYIIYLLPYIVAVGLLYPTTI